MWCRFIISIESGLEIVVINKSLKKIVYTFCGTAALQQNNLLGFHPVTHGILVFIKE